MRKLLLVSILLCATQGWGAWGGANSCTATNSKTANQSTIVVNECTNSAGDVAIVAIAVDNNQTTDGDESAVSFASETKGNTYTKACEFTNGQGSAQAGVTVSLWYSVLSSGTTLAVDSATFNLSNNTSRDAAAWILETYTIGAGNTVSVAGTCQTLANDAVDAGSQTISSLSSQEYLFFRVIGSEGTSDTISSATASYTNGSGSETAGGSGPSNMGIDFEFRILTGTGDTSDPTMTTSGNDKASVYVAFKESAPAATTGQGWWGTGMGF